VKLQDPRPIRVLGVFMMFMSGFFAYALTRDRRKRSKKHKGKKRLCRSPISFLRDARSQLLGGLSRACASLSSFFAWTSERIKELAAIKRSARRGSKAKGSSACKEGKSIRGNNKEKATTENDCSTMQSKPTQKECFNSKPKQKEKKKVARPSCKGSTRSKKPDRELFTALDVNPEVDTEESEFDEESGVENVERQSKKALAKRDRKLIAAALESAKQAIKGESSRHKDVAADRARLLDFQGPQPHEVSDDIKALVWGNIYSKTEV